MPYSWLALGLTILYAVSRTTRERHRYLRAIHPRHSEIAPFFWVGILLGIVISALMLVARLQVSLPIISIKWLNAGRANLFLAGGLVHGG